MLEIRAVNSRCQSRKMATVGGTLTMCSAARWIELAPTKRG